MPSLKRRMDRGISRTLRLVLVCILALALVIVGAMTDWGASLRHSLTRPDNAQALTPQQQEARGKLDKNFPGWEQDVLEAAQRLREAHVIPGPGERAVWLIRSRMWPGGFGVTAHWQGFIVWDNGQPDVLIVRGGDRTALYSHDFPPSRPKEGIVAPDINVPATFAWDAWLASPSTNNGRIRVISYPMLRRWPPPAEMSAPRRALAMYSSCHGTADICDYLHMPLVPWYT